MTRNERLGTVSPARRGAAAALAVAGAWGAACAPGDGGEPAAEPRGAPAALAQESGGADTGALAAAELVPIRVAGQRIMVEIAQTEAERQRGLMHRESLPPDQGMLFVYPEERPLGFWMKNTLIPLDIAYIDREGRIVDIQHMEPLDERTYPSRRPAMYALEMNQGWFEAHGVEVGDRVEF